MPIRFEVGCERLRREHRLSDQGSMLDLILHESKIIQDQWISFEAWTLNPWFCEVDFYFKYMAEECFMPVIAKLYVCDGKNGITMYCFFQ